MYWNNFYYVILPLYKKNYGFPLFPNLRSRSSHWNILILNTYFALNFLILDYFAPLYAIIWKKESILFQIICQRVLSFLPFSTDNPSLNGQLSCADWLVNSETCQLNQNVSLISIELNENGIEILLWDAPCTLHPFAYFD